jgi:hypothetical protein
MNGNYNSKKMVKQQENGQALVLLKKINKLKTQKQQIEVEIQLTPLYLKKDKISKEIEKCVEELPKICTHNKTDVIDTYESGSYYNTEKYIHTTVCTICGENLHQDITHGGYG